MFGRHRASGEGNRAEQEKAMQLRRLCLSLTILAALPATAAAQSYPNKTIRAVIPFAAGSATDIVPRVVFEQLSTQLGQPIVVENRGGAGGTLGMGAVAKADPDGYTLLANSSAQTIVPAIYPNLSFDPAGDFAGVALLGSSPNVLIVSPAKGFKTAADLVAAAKARPGSFNFASAGVGTATHLSAERFRMAAGFEAVHIPFRGGAEALTEVLAGRSEFYFCPLSTALPHIREGKVLALVVSTPKRTALLPDVPSALELFPDSDYPFWVGLFAPVKTPRDIVARLHGETMKAMQAPHVKERLAALGVETSAQTPEQFDAQLRAEFASTGPLAKAAGLKPN
jgi:tripartite-type tricarboxylate transporter receptor subunit TctC